MRAVFDATALERFLREKELALNEITMNEKKWRQALMTMAKNLDFINSDTKLNLGSQEASNYPESTVNPLTSNVAKPYKFSFKVSKLQMATEHVYVVRETL